MSVYTIITDAGKYKQHLALTGKSASALRRNLDTALRSAVYHVYMYGDVTGLNKLLKLTDNVVASNAHRKWLVDFAAPVMVWDADDKEFKARENKVRSLIVEADLMKAMSEAPAYYDHTKPPPFSGFSVAAQVNAIIKKAEKLAAQHASGELTEDKWKRVDLTGLASVRNLAKSLSKVDAGDTSEEIAEVLKEGSEEVVEG